MANKILIIDDDKVIVRYLGKFLTDNGYKTIVANDGKTGLTSIKTEKPDLIILDVMMETLFSGFEVYRKIKLDDDFNKIPIIGISGMADEINVQFDKNRDAEYFNPNEFLEKPVDKELLLKKVENLLLN